MNDAIINESFPQHDEHIVSIYIFLFINTMTRTIRAIEAHQYCLFVLMMMMDVHEFGNTIFGHAHGDAQFTMINRQPMTL